MSVGLCSLQPNESNQNIHFYAQIFCSISTPPITALAKYFTIINLLFCLITD